MSAHLDLDDVVGGHPVAVRELAELRAALAAAEARLTYMLENISERDFYALTYPHYVVGHGWSDRLAALDAARQDRSA